MPLTLPAHIIGIGPVEGNRETIFTRLQVKGAFIHRGPWASVDDLLNALETRYPFGNRGELASIHVVDCEGCEDLDVEFKTLITGTIDSTAAIALAQEALNGVITPSPEEQAWLRSRGFVSAFDKGIVWSLGPLTLLPSPAIPVDATYPRQWIDRGLSFSSYRKPLNLPVQAYCGFLIPEIRSLIEDFQDFAAGIVPQADADWLEANGFALGSDDYIIYRKSAEEVEIILQYIPDEQKWKAEVEHEALSWDDAYSQEPAGSGRTASEAYAEALDACGECVEEIESGILVKTTQLEASRKSIKEFSRTLALLA